MWVLTRRKLKGRLLEVIRRLETILRDFTGSIRERVTENKKKKILALKKCDSHGGGKRTSLKECKKLPRGEQGAHRVCQIRYKIGKKTLRSTFEESPKHIKGLFKSIKRKKLE